MKNIIISLFVCVLICSFAVAQGQGIHDAGTGLNDSELKEAGQGTGQGLGDSEPNLIQNFGQEKKIMTQSGNYSGENGNTIKVQIKENNQNRIQSGEVYADCPFNLSQEQDQNRTKLYAQMSNGQNAEIKIMPDTASQTALERLRLKVCNENCTLQLKEVGNGNQTKLAYELQTQRSSKVFGLFRARMNVQAQIDAENGELFSVNKPWWAFLASESEE